MAVCAAVAGIRVEGLVKSYHGLKVVDDVSFTAEPGNVTGLLGPNGSGKTTVLRLMTGLARGGGVVTYDGVGFGAHPHPRDHVGVSIGSTPFNLARTGLAHLELVAAGAGLARSRARESLVAVGLADVAHRRIKTYSLGMRQRLAIATAMIGDPGFVVLDEPTNGLDPTAVLWFESLVRRLAEEGRCVLVSTHQLHEAERFLDNAVVLVAGRVRAQGSLARLREMAGTSASVVAESDFAAELCAALRDKGVSAEVTAPGRLVAADADPGLVGEIAARAGVSLRGLRTQHASLEEVFARLCAPTHDGMRHEGGR